jgi:hypothetical protein
MYLRLHLLVLCLRPGYPNPNGFYIAGLSISILVTLSKPWQAHHNQSVSPLTQSTVHIAASLVASQLSESNNQLTNLCHIQTPYGGPGGSRTRVQDPFLSTSYSLNL